MMSNTSALLAGYSAECPLQSFVRRHACRCCPFPLPHCIILPLPFPLHGCAIVCLTCVRASKCFTFQPCNMVPNLVAITSEYVARLAACSYVPTLSYGRRMLQEDGDPNRLFLACIPTDHYYLSSSITPRIGTTGFPPTPPQPSRTSAFYTKHP